MIYRKYDHVGESVIYGDTDSDISSIQDIEERDRRRTTQWTKESTQDRIAGSQHNIIGVLIAVATKRVH